MADQPHETSLPILIRSCTNRESESSMEVNVSEHSTGSEPVLSLSPTRFLSFREAPFDSTGCETPPASPPSDPGPEAGNRLIDGVGGHFPATLPSRASTLTMESDSAANIPATPRAIPTPYPLETDGLSGAESELDTPRAGAYSSKPPLSLDPVGESNFGHVFPLTPGLTPVCKRTSSPPFAPRPVKKPRMDTPPVFEPSEDETYQAEPLRKRSSATAFRSARNLSIDLASTIGLETTRTEPQATQPRYVIETEPFAENEVEQYLAELLGAYRACYPEVNEGGLRRAGDPDQAQNIRHTLRTLFGHHLKMADDDWFLLQEEEEDVLDAFMTLIRDRRVLSDHQQEAFASSSECLQRLENLTDSAFVKRILLSVRTSQGSLLAAHLPARKFGGIIRWRLDEIYGIFREIAQLDIA